MRTLLHIASTRPVQQSPGTCRPRHCFLLVAPDTLGTDTSEIRIKSANFNRGSRRVKYFRTERTRGSGNLRDGVDLQREQRDGQREGRKGRGKHESRHRHTRHHARPRRARRVRPHHYLLPQSTVQSPHPLILALISRFLLHDFFCSPALGLFCVFAIAFGTLNGRMIRSRIEMIADSLYEIALRELN
jgi:hypothetical protein